MATYKQPILIIGAGSIGTRHLKNLLAIGARNISLLDVDNKKLTLLKKKYKVKVFNNFNQAAKQKFAAVFICTPPTGHTSQAIKFAKNNTSIFMEKPLADSFKDLSILQSELSKRKLKFIIGYVLNFHPQYQKIKEILDKKLLGKIIGVRAEFGNYLPDWRPGQDYRKNFGARRELGGGIVLDDTHEIDYVYGLFGKADKVFALAGRQSDLEINTEDYAEAIIWFKNGVVGEIHMDYLQRQSSRWLKIIGSTGSLYWDLVENNLKYYLVKDKKWHIHKIKNLDINQLYLEEIKLFLNSLNKKQPIELNFSRAYEVLKIALAIKQSAKTDKVIKLN